MLRHTILAAAISALAAAPAAADGLIVIDRRRPMPRPPIELAVLYHKVNVTIAGQTATTEIDQVFRNHNHFVVEGTYMFPLPEDSAISNLVLYVNGKPMSAELLDRDKARQIYESIVRSQKDPALLEYVGREMFRASIFPIPANGDTRVTITYSQLLRRDAGMATYRYPLNTEKFSSRPLQEVAVVCDITGATKLGSIVSPSHPIEVVRKDDTHAKVSWEARNVTPDKDFYLYIGSADAAGGMTLATHLGQDPEGTFLLMISPAAVEAQQKPTPKDVVFVLDTSGSMAEGGKHKQAIRALRQCLGRLRSDDRFGVVAFSTEARAWRDQLAAADDEAVKLADAWVAALEARGGTAIEEALAAALKMVTPPSAPPVKPGDPARPAYVVFITDGAPTIGERDPDRLLDGVKKQAPGNARIFCLGVGEDLNSYLVDKLADQHRGAREYVTGTEDVEQKISAFYDKIAFPVMTDLRLELVGLETQDVYPRALPDLFRGSQLTVLGRYKGAAGQYAVRVTGRVGGETHTLVYEAAFDGKSVGGELLPRLWAVRKIGYLLEEIRLRGETPEVKAEVVRLSKQYGVMTPYTSYLVVEDEVREVQRRGWDGRPGPANPSAPTAPGGAGGRAFGGAEAPASEPARADAARRLRAEDGGGIEAGDDLAKLKQGYVDLKEKDEAARRVMRSVGEKTFYRDGEAWVDAGFDPAKVTVVEVAAFSDAYWQLLADHPGAGKYLALGARVTVVLAGKAYRVAP